MVHSKYSLLLENILDPVKLSGDSYLRKLTTNHKSPVLNSNNRHSTRQLTVEVQTVKRFSLNIAPMALKERMIHCNGEKQLHKRTNFSQVYILISLSFRRFNTLVFSLLLKGKNDLK